MTQILIITDDKALNQNLNKNLIKYLGCEVVMQDSSRNAISMMGLIPEIDLIICKDVIKKDQVPVKMCEYLPQHNKDLGRDVLLLILGENKTDYAKATAIDPKASWEKIVVDAGALLGIKVDIEVPVAAAAAPAAPVVVAPSFYPLNFKYYYLLVGQPLKFDSYTKVKKAANVDYDLSIKAESIVDKVSLDKIALRGIQEFYITKEQYTSVETTVRSLLMSKVKNPPKDENENAQLNSDCYDLILDMLKRQEVDNYIIELATLNLKAFMLATTDARALDNFLKKRKTLKLSYAYTHVLLTCLIIQNIIKNFKWTTQEIKDNIVYILYFHDISLQNEKLMKIHHNYFQRAGELVMPEDKKAVLNHALNSANIIEKFKDLSPDIGAAIKEHHGIKSGSNFADSLSIIVTPFTMMLIVVEDYVSHFLEMPNDLLPHKEKDFIANIFVEMNKKYTKLTYLEACKATQKLIEEGAEKIAADEAAAASAARLSKAALAASVAAVTAAETAANSAAASAKAAAVVTRVTAVANKAAEAKANADKEVAAAVALTLKIAQEQAAAEQAVATALAAVQKAQAAKLAADQAEAVVKQNAQKAALNVKNLTAMAEKAKTQMIDTMAEKTAAEQASWKAADQAKADQEAKIAADQLSEEKAQAAAAGRKT